MYILFHVVAVLPTLPTLYFPFNQELLYNKHLYMDGQKLESIGFQLTKPQLTEELLREVYKFHVKAPAQHW